MSDYFISSDPKYLDFEFITSMLRSTYWASDRPRHIVEKAISASYCFGVYEKDTNKQVGFARLVTDKATFAWLCDVIIAPHLRNRGLGKRLLGEIVQDSALCTCRIYLGTKDAHALYERFGFKNWKLMKLESQDNRALQKLSGRAQDSDQIS